MIFTDLHCHPILKCYGKNKHKASNNVNNEANLFHHKHFNYWNRMLENIAKITPYRQSDLYSAYQGDAVLLGSSIYSPERDFFIGKYGNPIIEDLVTDFGTDWIKEIQKENNDYFAGLKSQFNFIQKEQEKTVQIKGQNYKYKLINSGAELKKFIQNPTERTVLLFFNIEGGHNLFTQVETQKKSSQKIVHDSIKYIKEKKPFYFTLAHHFYNQLSGHCKSLPPSLQNIRPQEYGSDSSKPLESGLRTQGRKVITDLLSKDNGQRILIDIKHMNPVARNQYYEILDEYKSKGDGIPILFSHGGANGIDSFKNNVINNDKLHNQEIGLYDDEIVRLIKSGGLFGLNLDERVMSSDKALDETKKYICPNKRFKATSGLIWNNIEQILKVTAKENLNPWLNIAIGSDFDGIINPVNGFWTLEYMPRLRKYLGKHIRRSLKKTPKYAYGMSSKEILDAIFSKNTIQFMIKNFGN